MPDPGSARLVTALQDPSFYDHPAPSVELVETHISWVFLAGDFAYKVKKPLDLGFLDFSTLAKRRHFCREELRLNRRFAPDLYLDVVPIGLADGRPVLGAEPAVDYAVKMRRFPRENQLDRMLATDRLERDHLERAADEIARLHRVAPVVTDASGYALEQAVFEPVRQNFAQLRRLVADDAAGLRLDRIEEWSRRASAKLEATLRHRLQRGFVRECHGDVHLRNMVWLGGRPLLFDCIEFSDLLRQIDVVNDAAFLIMDLDDRKQPAFGWAFLNRYLEITGDYAGVAVLDYYKIYRAMVRAKVGYLQLAQAETSDPGRNRKERLARSYLDLAAGYVSPDRPRLVISHGFSAAGKSTFVRALAPAVGAIRLHSDIERKRLFGLEATDVSGAGVGTGIYSPAADRATYDRLDALTRELLRAGHSVIVDATFLKHAPRRRMRRLAAELGVPFRILDFQVPEEELNRRVALRQSETERVSEAGRDVLDLQRTEAESLTAGEREEAVPVHAGSSAGDMAEALAGSGAVKR